MSSTPYLDKLFDISMRLNKASVYCSSNPLLMRQLERAICSINEHLFDVRCQRAMGKDADCLELQARTALSFFRHMFKDMTVIFEKEEEADKKAEEEERKMVANQEKTVSNDADLTSCLITLSSKLLEMFSTVQKELGEITEVLRKKPEESEETRHEVIRADYQEEIRRLKRARCRLSRKNSKLTEENEELMKENWELKAEKVDEFSKQFGSLQMNAELVAKCQAAMAEQQVLKNRNEFLKNQNNKIGNQLKTCQEERDRLEDELLTLRDMVEWDECQSKMKDEKIKQLEEEKVTLKKKLEDAEYEIFYR